MALIEIYEQRNSIIERNFIWFNEMKFHFVLLLNAKNNNTKELPRESV